MRAMQPGANEDGLAEIFSGHDRLKGTALAVPADDERSDHPVSALSSDELDDGDTTSILHGAAAISGKASWSSMRVAQANEALTIYEADKKRRAAREAEEARELAHLAEWNAQMTVVGGVRMTNEEAQAARKRALENADAYVDRAIAKGELKESDRADFKQWMARKIELEDKRGRGTITEAEATEEANGDRTRVGHAADLATGRDHQLQGAAPSVEGSKPTGNTGLQSGGDRALDDYALFQAKAAVPAKPAQEKSSPLSASVLATGLTL